MEQLERIRCVGTISLFQNKSIIIGAEDMDTLTAYLAEKNHLEHTDVCHITVTVGPVVSVPPIVLDIIPFPSASPN